MCQLVALLVCIVGIRMSKPVENFYKNLSEPKLMTVAGEQGLKCSGERQFCGFFYPFGSQEVRSLKKTT